MVRLACVDVPALPLQLLLRQHPGWRGEPVAVVAHERPQAAVLWASVAALRQGVRPGMRPGMRQAEAHALAPGLRAAVVPDEKMRAGVAALVALRRRFSPHVEPGAETPGVFWLDAGGLDRLSPSPEVWAEGIHATLRAAGIRARIAVGHSHFGSYAVARTCRGTVVLEAPRPSDTQSGRRPSRGLGLKRRPWRR